MEHTKEPWAVYNVEGVHGVVGSGVVDSDGTLVAEMWQRKELWSIANARRIVACVNACEGYTNDDLEAMTKNGGLRVYSFETVSAVAYECDTLKARVKELKDALEIIRNGGLPTEGIFITATNALKGVKE